MSQNRPKNLYLCTKCFELSSHGFGIQRCKCEPNHERVLLDCPNGWHLCYVCCIRVAGGTSRWAWEACEMCLAANYSLKSEGEPSLNLGRHSLMNGISGRISQTEVGREGNVLDILSFALQMQNLHDSALIRTKTLFKSVKEWKQLNQVPIGIWEEKLASFEKNQFIESSREKIKVLAPKVFTSTSNIQFHTKKGTA